MSVRRRSLLAMLPAAVAAWALARLGVGGIRDAGKLLRVVGDPGKARAIGEACARAIGTTSVREILRMLPAETDDLRARIRDDFAEGRIIVVDGWLLSTTEARLYALAANHRE